LTFRFLTITDYFQLICFTAQSNKNDLPPPLRWVEPSINMLYLEAVSSFLFGNYYSCIINTSALLEHTLRLAVLSPDKNGLYRKLSNRQINKYQSISDLLNAPNINTLIPDSKDKDWWAKIGKDIRNKSAHYLIPILLKRYTTKHYHPEHYVLTNYDGTPKDDNGLLHDWGSFFHKSNYFISQRFLNESYDQLTKLISNTKWQPDLSWWESQKDWYDSFFSYEWTSEKMSESIEKMFVTFPLEKSSLSDEE
jgi:hypothetical protein